MSENKLSLLVNESGIEKEKAKSIWVQFEEHFNAAEAAAEKVSGLEITDVSQVAEMKLAREVRLELRKIRVAAKKTHDELKEDSLKEGRFIDRVNKLIEEATTPIEASLKEKEEFAERKEAARIKALYDSRAEEIRSLDIDPTPYPLGQMSDESYQLLVDSFRVAKQAREEAERKAEEERIAREAAEKEERERKAREEAEERARIAAENARLKAEREERERQIAEERAKVEAERKAAEEAARMEREERERELAKERELAAEALRVEQERARREQAARDAEIAVERERQAEELRKKEAEAAAARAELERIAREKREAEEAERKLIEQERIAAEEEKRRLEQAGDREKLLAYLFSLMDIGAPSVKSAKGKQIIDVIRIAIQQGVLSAESMKK